MAFDLKTEIYVNGAWNDISGDVQQQGGVQITRGQQGTGVTQDASTCQLLLDNTSGNYSPDNPLGAYYGSIGRNTLCRVSLPTDVTHLELLGDAGGNASTPSIDITGDLDVRVELDAMLTSVQGTQVLAQKYTSGDTTNQAWQLYYADDGFIHFDWYDSTPTLHQSQWAYSAMPGRALRVTLDVDNGASGNTVTFYYADAIDGTYIDAGSVITSGTTSIHSTSAVISVGGDNTDVTPNWGSVVGYVRKFELYSGISGTLEANPDFTVQTGAAGSFTDGQGNTWTMNGSAYISDRDYRFSGTVTSWPITWVVDWVTVSVTAGSIRRRLGQGKKAVKSTLTQRVPSYGPLAYWPMEDGVNSTSFASGLQNGIPATFSGFTLAAESTLKSSSPLPTINTNGGANNSVLVGNVPIDTNSTQTYVTTTQTFTSSTSWTVPTGVTSAKIECWGAGGGGQGGSGGGGGGGEYARSNTVAVTPGESLTVTIGAGGSGGPGGAGGPGSNGGDTSVKRSSTTLVIAHGGKGSNSATTAGGTGSTAPVHYNGGGSHANTTGTSTGGAGGGSSAGTGAAGNTGASNSGTTGGAGASAPSGGGAGGRGGNGTGSSGTAGTAGSVPGGGGGTGGAGSSSNSAGGAGGKGQVKVTYTAPGAVLTGGNWSVFYLVKVPSAVAAYWSTMSINTAGTVANWRLQIGASDWRMIGEDYEGTTLFTQTISLSGYVGQWLLVQVFNAQNGANVDWGVTWTFPDGSNTAYTNTVSSASAAYVTSVGSPGGSFASALDGTALGHLSVWNTSSSDAYTTTGANASASPLTAYNGEYAGERACRVASENRIPFRHLGYLTEQERVGPQPLDTPLNIMDSSANTDFSLLVEDRAQVGLVFKDKSTLYQQTPVQVTYGQLQMGLTPTRDDTLIVNSFTATRDGGSSGQYQLDDGSPLSISDPPVGVGLYDASATYSLYTDAQTTDLAAWKVRTGTIDQPRYLAVTIELAKWPSLVDTVGALDVGDRLQVTDCPTGKTPPGVQDLLIIGYQEHVDHFLHTLAFNCVPYTPYMVAYADGTVDIPRVDSDDSTLAADATTTDTQLSVATITEPWTTLGTEYPFDVTVSGEQITMVGAGTVMNANPLILTSSSGWSSQNCTVTYDTSVVNSASGATASLKVVPNGVSASGGVLDTRTATGTITPGNNYVASGWVYSPLGWSDLRTVIDWYDSSGTFLSTGLGSATVVSAGVWTFITQTLTAPASSSSAIIRGRFGGTPASTDVSYWWNLQLVDALTVSTTSPQSFTVIRSVNGVVKSQTAGSDVSLTFPTYVAL